MYQEERQKLILEYVNRKKKVSTQELSENFQTSVVTIRSDLNALEKKGLLVKAHGGAMDNSYKINDVIPSDIKFKKNVSEKKKIAAIAKRYISSNDVIIIDSGSTTLELAKVIEDENLTVYTNDLQIALELAKKPNVVLNVTGGELIKGVYTFAGTETSDYYLNISADKLFLSCDALDLEFGISNRDKREIPIKQNMIKASREITLMLDHTKLNSKVLMKVTDLDNLDRIIVDQIDEPLRKAIEKKGIEVITE